MASNHVVIDLDDNRIFHASDWIGVGKNYPTGNSKLYIEDAKRQVQPPSTTLASIFRKMTWSFTIPSIEAQNQFRRP